MKKSSKIHCILITKQYFLHCSIHTYFLDNLIRLIAMSDSIGSFDTNNVDLEELEIRSKARQIQVSTDDNTIKKQLRQMQEPICLFGEGPVQRRDRLRRLLASKGVSLPQEHGEHLSSEMESKREDGDVTWYHEGPDELRTAREWIALDSLKRARQRLDAHRTLLSDTRSDGGRIKKIDLVESVLKGEVDIYCSQIGDMRPLSYCCLSPTDEILLTASWSGSARLWRMPECDEPIKELREGHSGMQMCCAEFHPESGRGLRSDSLANIATSGFDGSVRLWSLEDRSKRLMIREGYRVNRVRFHPTGRFLASCCHDESWRLYDIEADIEVLHQEGHVGPVLDIAFQCDGSVCVTGGEDTYGRVWDLRSGRCVMFLNGHLRSLLTTAFSPNGYQMATGGLDNTVKIWDLRIAREQMTIAAHTNLVSQVRFQRLGVNENACLSTSVISTSYDGSLKIWSGISWNLLKVLNTGHEQRVTGFDISRRNAQWIVTCSADRSFKVWKK
ncbi:hypothetical protein ACOME3_000643 [Neoechinorhynchus agilis]